MLYERFEQVARTRRSELALVDLAGSRRWTFGQLLSHPLSIPPETLVCPGGCGPEFVLEVLRGWRHGAVVCPLEENQSAPGSWPVAQDVVHLKATSATTGAPRWIQLTAAQLAADAENIVRTMGLRVDWPNLAVISLAHSYGFSSLVLALLLHGIPLYLLGSPMPEALRRVAPQAGGWTLPAVPALWRAWQEAEAIPSNIHLAISAGAMLPLELEQTVYRRTGLKIHNFYGASECGGIAFDPTSAPRSLATLVGTALAGVRLSLNSDQCLVVESEAVAQGYWPQEDSSLGAGRYETRDLAVLKDGLVHLRGRASDLINVAGRKVAPETVEQVLGQCPGVQDCLVFGVAISEAAHGDEIVACVVGQGNGQGRHLRQRLLEVLPAWQVPRRWWFVDAIPANPRGKISRAEWRHHYLKLGMPGQFLG